MDGSISIPPSPPLSDRAFLYAVLFYSIRSSSITDVEQCLVGLSPVQSGSVQRAEFGMLTADSLINGCGFTVPVMLQLQLQLRLRLRRICICVCICVRIGTSWGWLPLASLDY